MCVANKEIVSGSHAMGIALTDAPVELPVPARKLTKWNIAMCIFHGFFGVITLVMGNLDLRVPVYGSSVELIIGGENGSAWGTNATDGWALKPDFSERACWMHLTWATAMHATWASTILVT